MRKLRLKIAALYEHVRSVVAFRLWLLTSYAPVAGADQGTQLLTNIDAALKDLYLGPIVEQLNNKTYMLDQIERDSEKVDFTGRRAVVPIRTGRNTGRGARADNSTLPLSGRQNVKDAIIPIRYHYFGIEISDPTIEATKRNEGAFISAMELESEGVTDDARKDMNREIFGQLDAGGNTGLLATVATTQTSTTVAVDSVQYIQIGDPIDVLNQTSGVNPTNGLERIVTSRVAGATKTITFAVGGTIAATATNDGVYIAGARGNEMDGLRGITAPSGTLHSLSPVTDFTGWVGAERDAASAVAGESLFEQLADDVGQTGRGEVDAFITTRGIRRRLADTYQSQKRFNDARATEVHGGYSAIMVNEIPVVSDDDCPKGFAFGLNKGSFRWYQLAGPSWLEQGNGQILSLKDGATGRKTNVWQGFLKWYAALGTNARNRNGRIKSAADDNAV